MPYVFEYREEGEEAPFYVRQGNDFDDFRLFQRAKVYFSKGDHPGRGSRSAALEKVLSLLRQGREPIIARLADHLSNEEASALEEATVRRYGRKNIDKGGVLLQNFRCSIKLEPYQQQRVVREKFVEYLNNSKGIKKPKYSAWIAANKEKHCSSHHVGKPKSDATKKALWEGRAKYWVKYYAAKELAIANGTALPVHRKVKSS